jgi:hypothetical protein
MNAGSIGRLSVEKWAEMKTGTVPDSLRANVELMRHATVTLGIEDPITAVMQLERARKARGEGTPNDAAIWTHVDFERMSTEYQFSWNWCKAGSPIFALTHSTAALLSTTRAPVVDFEHAPFASFLICVPHAFLPMISARPQATRWIGVASGALMGAGGGMVLAIPDSDTLANVATVGADGRLSEATFDALSGNSEWKRLLGVAVRLAANVIQYVTQYRESDCVRRVSSAAAPAYFELRPPPDVVVDRAFRDLASDLVRARDFKGAHRALAHIVRGHWRNQPVGPGRAERRLVWIQPFRRGDECFGNVVQRTIRLGNDSEP